MLKSVTEGTTPVLLAGALALMAQGAWSDENRDSSTEPVVIVTATATATSAKLPVEIDIRAYIEALNKQISDELTREIEALNAARVELAIAEVPTRG